MNYKETLVFIGKCLTITHEKHNKTVVQKEILSTNIDWDLVVKISTEHYVFPALYCNLKRAEFLDYLPQDLVTYMEHISSLNRDRNLQIIAQAKEINTLLLANGITPIFLKGTAFLLEGLYEDIAERMVGDIDFLVSNNNFSKAVALLKNAGYQKTTPKVTNPVIKKHYPRLYHENSIAAVEIHKDMVRDKAATTFNYNTICTPLFQKEGFCFLNYKDQILLTILAKQYNDRGYLYKSISLRNSYDLFLLALNHNTLEAISNRKGLFKMSNAYLAATAYFLNSNLITFKKSNDAAYFKKVLLVKLKYPLFRKVHNRFCKFLIYVSIKFTGIVRFLTHKEFRAYYIKKLKASEPH